MTALQEPPIFVVDTSVALKWFVYDEEPDVRQAWRLQDAHAQRKCVLHAPELLLFELANALKAGRRLSVTEVLKAVDGVLEIGIRLEAFRHRTLGKAVEIATLYNASVYDSYFLATAVHAGGTFVTADEIFLKKAVGHPGIVSLRRLNLPD